MRQLLLTAGFMIWLAAVTIGPAMSFGLGYLGSGLGKMGAQTKPGSGTAPTAACVNGNLLLVYNDPCQLMSQMVGN